MRPIFFSFKSINITWFTALSLLATLVSYLLLKLLLKNEKDSKQDRENLENIFFLSLLSGFIGARLTYVIFNFGIFMSSPSAIIKLSHYNLSLVGGLATGLLVLIIFSKKYKLDLLKTLDKFSILFYVSMAIGVWNLLFDRFLLQVSDARSVSIKVITLSILFTISALIQITFGEKYEKTYITIVLLALTLIIYYIIKLGLIF